MRQEAFAPKPGGLSIRRVITLWLPSFTAFIS
jgi:hypothetical protein